MFNNLRRRIQPNIDKKMSNRDKFQKRQKDTRLNTEPKIDNSEYRVCLCLINLARLLIL